MALLIAGLLLMLAGVWVVRTIGEVYPPAAVRRCPGCSYDLSGVPGLRCPECGRLADRESDVRMQGDRPARDKVRGLALGGGVLLIMIGLAMAMLGAWWAASG